ncbi:MULTISPECIES: LuxR C-terminal-related transcriptional regulator [unclassified Vibrio]|uniref:LuxR C-terminal-related transcriptional regulator n=1 Tax=Vibrio sp. HB236076 TaxID=3232307 RepID=A0AB39HFK2_9VIBR|nr:LuxR C-terminal-related transcriptional regulator [Vibrio sp. HB161653]MDP5253138.1 LuxR C-terminal-related transcriptional regulator [Vibrio sp. HB161653]
MFDDQLRIQLLASPSVQNQSFCHLLVQHTQLPIELVDYRQAQQVKSSVRCINVFDCQLEWPDDMCRHFNHDDKVVANVLLNIAPDTPIHSIAQWQKLKGVFQTDDSLERVCQGLKAIVIGENWLSRRFSQQLLDYLQTTRSDILEPNTEVSSLTKRERQVLISLKQGQSNMDIAQNLFVSEHTIKSHLYKIFKKIEVKNRTQAIEWAKCHL